MTRRLLLSMVLALAAGCAQERDPGPDLALYCQVKGCLCKRATLKFGEAAKPVAVLWRSNGEAYCPPDYRLEPTAKVKSFKRHYGG